MSTLSVSKCGMHALRTIIVYLGFPMIQWSELKGCWLLCANGGVFVKSETVFNPK